MKGLHMKKKRLTDAMILVIFCIASIISLLLVGTITVDSSTEAFMPQEAPVVQINEELEQRFGSTDAIVIGLSTRFGSILHPQYLATIDGMTERVSGIAGVGQAISITNADHISASNEGIQIVSLYDPESDRSLSSMKQYLDDWPEFYQSNLIAADESMASIIVQPQSGLSAFATEKILAEIRTIVDATDQDSLDIAIIGLPVIKSEINRSLVSDIIVLAPIVAVIIIIVLIIAFRHVSAVVLSMITLVIAVALTVGTIALLDITFTMATMLVPVLLVIVGSAYSIHVMSHFQKEVNKHTSFIPPEEIGRIVSKIIRNNKTPIIMAGATTAAGFIAQLFSPLQPFRTFGLLCAFGVLLSQITSLIILPILLRLTYRNGMRITQSSQRTSKIRSNHWNLLIRVNQQHRLIILSLFILLIFAMIVSVFRIPVGTDLLSFFKDNTKLVNDTKLFNDKMGGSGVLAVAIEADTPGSIMTPSFLTTISEFETIIQDDPAVGKIQSIIPYVERINRTINWDSIPYRPSSYSTETAEFDFFSIDDNPSIVSSTEELLTSEHATEEQLISRQDFNSSLENALNLSGGKPGVTAFVQALFAQDNYKGYAFNEIPVIPEKYGYTSEAELKDMLAQYLMMYSGNLSMFIDDAIEPRATLVTIQVHDTDPEALRRIVDTIEAFWSDRLESQWKMKIGGGDAVSLALVDLVTKSQIFSVVGALLIVWLLVSVMFRSPIAGLLSLIPVIGALAGICIVMATASIHLDIITSLLAAIAIGTGVDYAIHMMNGYKRLNTENGSDLQQLFTTTGRAVIINAVSISIGFCGLLFSRFVPIQQLGLLFSVSTVCSSVASLTVLPTVIELVKPKALGYPVTTIALHATDRQRRVMQ